MGRLLCALSRQLQKLTRVQSSFAPEKKVGSVRGKGRAKFFNGDEPDMQTWKESSEGMEGSEAKSDVIEDGAAL